MLVAIMVGAIPAAAVTTTSWASWQPLAGAGGAYTTSVQIAAQPAITATMTSDSRSGQAGVISGASTWLSEGTPVGAKYGSSVGQPYLNLRPKTDTATGASTTTYSFAAPTPTSGWTFVLGDIDADSVRIQAVGPDGLLLDDQQLGFRGGFNYCAPGLAGKPSCSGDAADIPTWDPATLTLTGNAAAADTAGAAAWFEPSAPISALTFSFTRRAGLPVYQTWFASIARDITGTVSDPLDVPQPGVTLTLTDATGAVVGTTTTAADGTYSFPGIVATDGYTVRATAPDGSIIEGQTTRPVDLTDADGVADFTVRPLEPVAVSGVVLIEGTTTPVVGATVTIDGVSTTTDANGFYLFDRVEVGPHTVVVTAPDGYTLIGTPPLIEVPGDSEEPITAPTVYLVENPDLSGTVRAGDDGVAGVIVTASAGDASVTAVTDANGDYVFPRLPAGDYTITITTPEGYTVVGPSSQAESVATTDVVDVDFALARPGSIDGVVRTDDGQPIGGVVITLGHSEGEQTLTTDAEGAYSLSDLPPGTYTLTVTPPPGTTVVGDATRTVVITEAGEAIMDQDFTLAADDILSPPDPDGPGDPDGPTSPPNTGDDRLPATGLAPETFAWAIGGAVVLIIGGVLVAVSRRRSNRD